MRNDHDEKRNNTTKLQIIYKSGCVTRLLLWIGLLIVILSLTIMMHAPSATQPTDDVGGAEVLTLLLACPLCALTIMKIFNEAATTVKVLSGQYEIVITKVLAIKLPRRFYRFSTSDRALELSNGMHLTVDQMLLNKTPVGTDLILVFVVKNTYPILVENAKSFAMTEMRDSDESNKED